MPNGNNSAAMRGKLRLIRWLVACTQVPSWLMWRPVGAALATRVGPSRRRHHATLRRTPHAPRDATAARGRRHRQSLEPCRMRGVQGLPGGPSCQIG
jgi:hypothetical protein